MKKAATPEDLARLFVEYANAGDAESLTRLYEPDAVLDFPAGTHHTGHDEIRAVLTQLVSAGLEFTVEAALPTLITGDIALTATRPADGTGGRTQVARRQADGSWLRILDRPEAPVTS
ncbi:ketosteroid isomerase-like protein [Kibdelosporangium banguiense]|uniref:Ketosteroid isomerase-like protein n=1 Tax=Kibdelosporangium banguiense TaxID=1365924 RepID=A0ABS4TLH0_9PSEU|nr:nuclear transport factor 2 family protein [Kibdelosporangium banguiense]MBP2325236.1 ketosteroid isomerase-like protein [Kibdelosporangium banguiense]